MKRVLFAAAVLLLGASTGASADRVGITLRGSRASMERQNRIARAESFSFLRTNRDVARFADAGELVPVTGGEHYQVVADWPWARPVVRDFVERLAGAYHAGCGEPLVVTSLTRPVTRQPQNASPLSVHPAGMAVDLRVSSRRRCVKWLAAELLRLESVGLLDGTREFHPPHFHVAVFPEEFAAWEAELMADSALAAQVVQDSLDALRQPPLPAIIVDASGAPPAPWRPGVLLVDLLALVGHLLLRV